MKRRFFFSAAAGALVAPRAARAATAQATVLLNEPVGEVSPLVHSHFVEHLGGVVYDGVWVGEGSKIPNVGGVRKSLVDALRKIEAPLYRWPGGCFADSYNWKDGVGPRAQRPKRTNFWIDSPLLYKNANHPAKFDTNEFGTNEFMRFCQAAGGKPYFAANVRSGTPREFYEWVEYCNAPSDSTTWSTLRGEAPYNVEYWGIGNESWGCGGDFTPEEYSVEFRKFTSWAPKFGVPLKYIATGPNGGDLNWTRGFLEGLIRKSRGLLNRVWGFALHYYCGTTGKGQAVDFTTDDWYDLIDRGNRMEALIREHWTIMGEFDRERRIKLAVDEWGTWHRAGSEIAPHHLFGQQSTMRDAIIAALTLDIFHRHADKVAMSNIAQLINCIHSLFLAHEDQFLITPTYHVFDMYQGHKGGRSVQTVFGAPSHRKAPGCAGSATVKDKRLLLTAVNTSHDTPLDLVVSLQGAAARGVQARVLSGKPQDHNSFNAPDLLTPRPLEARAQGSELRVQLPAAAVASLQVELV